MKTLLPPCGKSDKLMKVWEKMMEATPGIEPGCAGLQSGADR
jgi:hypothetical protein